MGWTHVKVLLSPAQPGWSVELDIPRPATTGVGEGWIGSGTFLLHASDERLAPVSVSSPFYLAIRSRLLHGWHLLATLYL